MPILVTNNFPPTRGGIQTMMSRLAECFVAKGHEVIVVAPREKDSERYDSSLSYRVVRYAKLRRPLESFAIAAGYLSALRGTRDCLTIASVWWPVGLSLALLPRALRGPLAILVHGTEVSPGRKGVRRQIMRAVFGRADVVIANSRFTAGLLHQAGVGGDIRIISLGVDMEPVVPERASVPTVLSVGRLVERKGFDRLLDAMPRLRDEFPDLAYEIVGDGPERKALEERAQRLGVGAAVTFSGSVSERKLRDAYARAWCFALPVRKVQDDVEGFGIVYLEAAMASLPSLGGIASGATDAIVEGETGLLVDGTSIDAIVFALGALLRDRERSETMGRRGFERARRLTWMQTTDQLLAAIPDKWIGSRSKRDIGS